MRENPAVNSQKFPATGRVWRSRVRRLVLLTLIPGGTCAALLFAPREEERVMDATPASLTDSHQRPDSAGETASASSLHAGTPTFVLGGVVADDDPKLGYAMIGRRGSSVALYQVGDQIQNGVRLHAVYLDRVLLELNGTIQTLGFAGSAGIAMPSQPSRTPSNTAMSGHPGLQVEVSAPGLLRDALQYSELHVTGRLRALRVSPGRDVQALQQLGLRPGDLVIAINGIPIEEHPSGERALELLGDSSGGRVTIVRNGSRQDLVIHHAGVPRAPLEW